MEPVYLSLEERSALLNRKCDLLTQHCNRVDSRYAILRRDYDLLKEQNKQQHEQLLEFRFLFQQHLQNEQAPPIRSIQHQQQNPQPKPTRRVTRSLSLKSKQSKKNATRYEPYVHRRKYKPMRAAQADDDNHRSLFV